MTPSRQVFKVIRTVYREHSPTQLALGLTMGLWLAGTPTLTLHGFFFVALLFVVRLNLAALIASYLFFLPIFYFTTPVSDSLGRAVLLKTPVIRPVLAGLFHAPIFPFTRFYNSVVMGSFLLCLVLAPTLFIAARIVLGKNHARLYQAARDSKLWKRWVSSRIYRRNTR